MAISSITRLAIMLCDVINTIDAASDEEAGSLLKQARLVNQLAMLGFSVVELGVRAAGGQSKTLVKIKSFEMIPRMINLPIRVSLAAEEAVEEDDGRVRTMLKFFQKGVVAPLADITRAAAEVSVYQEKAYLGMTPEERATTTRPVYGYDPVTDAIEVVGQKPIDPQECQKNLEAAQTIVSGASVVRLGAEAEVLTQVVDVASGIYQGIRAYLERFHVHVRNLRDLPLIPPPLFQDDVLSQYICPILNQPIRHPVGDPTSRNAAGQITTIYEARTIQRWLEEHPTSPVSRHPLHIEDLVPMPALQNLIDSRLEEHDRHFQDYLLQTPAFDDRLQAPPPAALQGAADVEHPRE